MRKATQIFVLSLIFYASLLTALHGVFELAQGHVATGGMAISAIGAPCQAETVWHACFPALTVLPTFFTAGLMTLILTGLLITRGIRQIIKPRQDMALFVLTVMLLLSGGGFIAFFVLTVASVAAYWPHQKLRGQPNAFIRLMAKGWPWLLFVYFLLVGTEALLGGFKADLSIQVNFLLPLGFLFLLLTAVSAYAWDVSQTTPE